MHTLNLITHTYNYLYYIFESKTLGLVLYDCKMIYYVSYIFGTLYVYSDFISQDKVYTSPMIMAET